MSDDKLIEVFLNPLQFIEVDEPWATARPQELTPEAILDFVCTPGIGSDVKSIISRYKKISTEKPRLFAAPHEQRILDKLIWPLRHAKAGYMVGNYVGTIALCGMVGEMVAVLLYEISTFSLNNKPMTEQDEINIFGRRFEKLGQERRVQVLHAYGVIDTQLQKAFELIRITRNKYLHLWSQDHDQLPNDAIASYNAAIVIAVSAIGQNIQDGKLILNPSLVKYLAQKGIYKDKEETMV
ncbi:MAG: hypothetical protein WC769_05185 [Thermodesulfovibrionales bacterium]|jgi:hypothetical protein